MICSFADKTTEALYQRHVPKGVSVEIATRAFRLLARIDSAMSLGDLQTPPSNRLHKLQGDKAERWSVSVNMQYRITFRFKNGDAHNVRFEDYH